MHRISLTALFITILIGTAGAQVTVLPITVEQKPNEFYAEQVQAWTKVTEREPGNAEAWWNLYLAARYQDFPAIFRDSIYKKKVDAIVEDMRRAIPDSYEANYIYAWNRGFGENNLEFLLKAFRIDSTRPRILEDLFTHYHAEGDWEMARYYMEKWYAAKSFTPQLLHLGYNLLASTEQDGILFTSGDNDSYPIYMLQIAKQVRPDVAALNVYLLQNKEYTRRVLKKYDIQADQATLDLLGRKDKDVWPNTAQFIRKIAEQNPDRCIYLPPTMVKDVQEVLETDLYVVGPLFQYSTERFDNIAVLKRNWYQNMHLDYLDFTVYSDDYHYTPAGLPYTVYIYFYPATALYRHYKAAGETQKADEMLAFCEQISRQLGDPELYKSFFK